MPSTYSTDLRIELIANGEQSGLWGATTNTNLGTLIEDAISGLASVSITSANQALTASNGSADQARCAAVSLTTTTTAAFNVYVPPVTKLYVIKNASAYAATIYCSTVINNTTAAGTGVTIPAGKSVLLRADGTNVVEQLDHVVGAFGVGGALTVTGTSTLTGNTAVGGTTTLQNALVLGGSPGTAGQVVVSQGAGTAPVWGNAFVTGMIMMWSGSIASIPSGWVLCNGSSGTPDLRDRFVVGAGSTYAVGATGGSANATLVSHTHTATTTATDSGHSHSYTSTAVPGGSGVASRVGIQTGATTGVGFANITASTSISTEGSSATNANLPPYYALAYIMKL
jgi:microcystin-dependent protein